MIKPLHYYFLSLCLCLCACEQSTPERADERVVYTVTRVLDGDSLLARANNQEIEIRLFGIDAPEHKQTYSRQARSAAERLLNHQSIYVKAIDRDRYGRVVAIVHVVGHEPAVNTQLVEQGAAWVYRRYTDDKVLIEKERSARQAGRGLWSQPPEQRIPPWEWRQRNNN